MRKRSSIKRDANQLASSIVEQATGEEPEAGEDKAETEEDAEARLRREAAAILGRLGGKKGGPARAAKLSAERRTEIARTAARVRWRTSRNGD